MSVASSVVLAERPAAHGRRLAPGRLALLFGVICATSLSAFGLSLLSYVRPIGYGDALPGYTAIAPRREEVFAFFLVAGVQLVIGVTTLAVACLILAPARGSRLATAGSSMIWLGAAVYGVGIGGWATAYYFASDAGTLGTAAATRLLDRIDDDTRHMLVVPIGGAVLVALGSLVVSAGVWRARTVPRTVILLSCGATVATLALPPSAAAGVVAEALSSATSIAIGWYAWRPWKGAPALP
jgi:hypothetical protein